MEERSRVDHISVVFPLRIIFGGTKVMKMDALEFITCNGMLLRLYFRVNVTVGALEERQMLSGMHTVADIFCCSCGQIVGWKYESAQEKSQKYKEGKFVLERGRIVDEIDFSTEGYIDTRPTVSDAEE